MSHLAEIYRLFSRRITAEFVIPICISVGVYVCMYVCMSCLLPDNRKSIKSCEKYEEVRTTETGPKEAVSGLSSETVQHHYGRVRGLQ